MSLRRRRRRAPRSVFVTAAEYAMLVDCRCRLLPGTHQALHCALLREQAGGRRG